MRRNMIKVGDLVGVGPIGGPNRNVQLFCKIDDIQPDIIKAYVINGHYYIGITPDGIHVYGAPTGDQFHPDVGIIYNGPVPKYKSCDYIDTFDFMDNMINMNKMARWIFTLRYYVTNKDTWPSIKNTRSFKAMKAFKTVWDGKYYHNEVDDDIPF